MSFHRPTHKMMKYGQWAKNFGLAQSLFACTVAIGMQCIIQCYMLWNSKSPSLITLAIELSSFTSFKSPSFFIKLRQASQVLFLFMPLTLIMAFFTTIVTLNITRVSRSRLDLSHRPFSPLDLLLPHIENTTTSIVTLLLP